MIFYAEQVRKAALLMVMLAIAISACVAGASPARAQPEPSAYARVWPLPPDPARIGFTRSIERPSDAGAKISGWGKLGNFITGGDKGNEPLVKPFGLGLDEQDNLCLTDTGAAAVCFWDRQARRWQRWTQVGKLRFSSPVAVAKRGRNLYVADSGLNALVVFDHKGKLLNQVTNNIGRPSGVAASPEAVFIADSQRHCVSRFTLAGEYVSSFGRRGAGEGQFNFPTHLYVHPTGEMLVTDSMNHRIQVFGPDGTFVSSLGQAGDGPGAFSRPKGVAMDADRNVYVIDGLADRLQIFNLQGQLLLNVGEPGSSAGQFWLPNGVAIDRSGAIYVADSYNRRLQVLQYMRTP